MAQSCGVEPPCRDAREATGLSAQPGACGPVEHHPWPRLETRPGSPRPGAWGECRACLEGTRLTAPQQAFAPWGLPPHDGPAKLVKHVLCVSRHPLFCSH